MSRITVCCLMLVLLLTGCKQAAQKDWFLPEPVNDHLFAAIGGWDDTSKSSSLPAESSLNASSSHTVFQPMQIQTQPEQSSYPVGTKEVVLIVTNHSKQDLLYSEWFDYRRIEGEEVIPLEPREDEMINQGGESMVLKAGGSVYLHVPLDIFSEPLTAGVYRVSQLACYADNFACTEITTAFTLE